MPHVGANRLLPASSELARDINRRIVFDLIRQRQPLSRADLSRASGLQRSTVSLIVDGLVDGRWVLETPGCTSARGRRPTLLRLTSERGIIGIDIRPSNTSFALADLNGRFLHQFYIPTPADPRQAVAEIASAVAILRARFRHVSVEGIGVAIPGRVHQGRLVFVPNLPWQDFPLLSELSSATALPVEIENAASASALAFAWFHPTSECDNLVCITVSDGVGAGILLDGRLGQGLHSMAGEVGHVTFDPSGPLCGCGSRGCWETFASNRAGLRYYRELSGSAESLSFPQLLDRAEAADPHAREALLRMARAIGTGLRNIISTLAPERILLVGDIVRCWPLVAPVIQAEVAGFLLPGAVAPHLEPEPEGGAMRLRGTVALFLHHRFAVASTRAAAR